MEKNTERTIRDEELIRRSREGDEAASNELMSRYKAVVRNRASSYFMAGADQEDLIQEGMIGVFKAIRDYDEKKGASFRTFAELCIQRQIISAVKGASRMKHAPLNESVSLNRPVSDGDDGAGPLEELLADEIDTNPEKMLLLREDMSYISQNIDDILSTLELQVWKMYVNGCSYREIAEKLDKTSKGVDSAIQRAKKKLAEIIDA
ncbi:MAG: RNA polymerase factor sigma-70 [Anaerovoracaceae bacterium]|nr:RNA polymerase factor sigma-70 [Bacillota bacterium]MDY5905958.1 RNA polymerase factor sigma-70 [Anaerovoracaceae bacterium]